MPTFRKNSSNIIQLNFDRTCVDDPGDVAEAFATNFYTTHSHTSPPLSSIPVFCSHFLPLVHISDFDIQPAVQN